MAAFSHQQQHSHPHPPFFLDSSVFLPNSFINMSGSLEEVSINNISSYFPYSSPSEPFQHISSFDAKLLPTTSNNEPYVTEKKQRADSSSMVVDLDANSDHQLTQKSTPMDNKRKNHLSDGSCLSSAESKEPKQAKAKKQRKCNQNLKEKEEKKNKECKKTKKEVSDQVPPIGYVHVRARRGEATDSHSLAERVRRERISERLKMLQALVPGCDKVSSKALMLDEIINYVQSLQHQVEFLSMKLSSVSPMFYDFGGMDLDSLVIKPEIPSTLASQLQSVQQSIPTPSTTFADITSTYSTTNNYPLLDNSLSLMLQQGLLPNDISQDNGSLLWGVDEQRQRISNQSDLTNLCSFQ